MYSGEKNKVSLYHMMNCSGSDETFESLLNTFILIYLKDIYERNKTENVKYLNDN